MNSRGNLSRLGFPPARLFDPAAAGTNLKNDVPAYAGCSPVAGLMLQDVPDDLMSRLGCRIAYGEAARLAEMARYDHGWGRVFAAGAGSEAAAIERGVMRRVSPAIRPELVRLAVEGAKGGTHNTDITNKMNRHQFPHQ